MRCVAFIFLALLAALLCGWASDPKPVSPNAAQIDARNRLLSVGGVTNAYDMSGNRVGFAYWTNSSIFVINPNSALPQVLMRIKNGFTNYYVYGAGLLYQITETATGTNTLTYHYDYRGNTVELSADNGAVTDRIEYSAYGLTTYRGGTNDTPFLFNGLYGVQTDSTGLLYMRARYYNPYICRFLNPDPSEFNAGLNFYAFCNDNPISNEDPFGLEPGYGNPVYGSTGPIGPSDPYAPGGAYYVPYTPTLPPNYTAPNPSGSGVIVFDSGISIFVVGGGGVGTQIVLLGNGQIVSYGYWGVGLGLGGSGGNFGLGQVYNVFQATDYAGKFVNVAGGLGVGGASISSWPGGSASYAAGAGTTGISGTFQYYWIIDATDPVGTQSPSSSGNTGTQSGGSFQLLTSGQSSPTGKPTSN
jgi:RHS repeat-associated protein